MSSQDYPTSSELSYCIMDFEMASSVIQAFLPNDTASFNFLSDMKDLLKGGRLICCIDPEEQEPIERGEYHSPLNNIDYGTDDIDFGTDDHTDDHTDDNNFDELTETQDTNCWLLSEEFSQVSFTQPESGQPLDTLGESGSQTASPLLLKLKELGCVALHAWQIIRSTNKREEGIRLLSSIKQPKRVTLVGVGRIRECVTQLLELVPTRDREKVLSGAISSGVPPDVVEEVWPYGTSGASRKHALSEPPAHNQAKVRRRTRTQTQH